MALFDAILGGLFDAGTASATNKANRENTNALIGSQKANQDRAIAALGGSDAFATTTQNASGGFDVSQPGGADAAGARGDLAFGDIGRAGNVNEATNNFEFTLPNLADARGIVEQENALGQGQFQKGLNDIITTRQRLGGGINNQPFEGATIDAIGRFADANRLGSERDAIDLFNKSGQADQQLLQQIIANNQSQAPAPGFTSGGPGGVAAQVTAQTPITGPPIDLSGAIPFAAGGSIIAQIQQEEADKRKNEQFLAALRTLGNQ